MTLAFLPIMMIKVIHIKLHSLVNGKVHVWELKCSISKLASILKKTWRGQSWN